MSGVWCHRCNAEHGDSSDAIPWCDPSDENDPWLKDTIERLSNTHKFRNRGLRTGYDDETYAWWERIADAAAEIWQLINKPVGWRSEWRRHLWSAVHDLRHLFDKRPFLWRYNDDCDFYSATCTLCGWSNPQ